MEQRIGFDVRREIIRGTTIEIHIAEVDTRRFCGAAGGYHVLRREEQQSEQRGYRQDQNACRQEPSRATCVEAEKVDVRCRVIFRGQKRCNQVTGENEKYVDTDESPGTPRNAAMATDHA